MGTNYYWHETAEKPCDCGAKLHDVIHVGKLSVGWAFCFRVYPDSEQGWPQDSAEWRNWMIDLKHMAGGLHDEYGRRVQVEKFWGMVDDPKRKAQLDIYAYHREEVTTPPRWENEFRDRDGHRCKPSQFS